MQSKDWIASKATEKSPKLLKKLYKRELFGGEIKIKSGAGKPAPQVTAKNPAVWSNGAYNQ